jgi:hypothetical protein
MKKLLLSLTAFALSTVLFAQSDSAVAKFNSTTIDLGKIKQDNPTTATFEVTNIGTEPLVIEQATPTCGCTIGDYTKEPIAPGKSGFIKATYNAKNVGMFEKRLNVKFAGYDMRPITIKGEVLKNEDAAATTTPSTEPAKVAAPGAPVLQSTEAVAPKKTAATAPAKKAPVKKANPTKKP